MWQDFCLAQGSPSTWRESLNMMPVCKQRLGLGLSHFTDLETEAVTPGSVCSGSARSGSLWCPTLDGGVGVSWSAAEVDEHLPEHLDWSQSEPGQGWQETAEAP